MLKNYFKLGFRNLQKYRLSSMINILGLALAVGCCLMVFEYLNWSTHQDNFNSKINSLYVIERVTEKNGNQQYYGNSPAPLGPMLKSDFPQIKNFARLNYRDIVIKQGDNVFRESLTFVDDAFYKMFDFPIKWGDKQYFTDQDGIVLTEELSEKLFGNQNPVGKNVSIRLTNSGKESKENCTVKGVFGKRPTATSFYFSALVPISKMNSLGLVKAGDWSQSADITFIEADDKTALNAVVKNNKKYTDLYNPVNRDDITSYFHYQPLKTMNFHADNVNRQYFNSMKPAGLIMLLVIAVAILLLVYFNYMNITIATAASRLKEISVRKVMGSNRKQIVLQFIIENLMLCTMAVLAGLFLAKVFFIPWFSSIANVDFGKELFSSYNIWIALVVLVIVSALSGAAYPALYISFL
jgi:putative ABC transport system permease protein